MAREYPNQYPGRCVTCGNRVEKDAGFRIKEPGYGLGGWETICAPCKNGDTPTPVDPTPSLDKRPSFPPTPEQSKCVTSFGSGDSLAIKAGAGTGKTSTLIAIGKSTDRNGQYVAFNKAIVTDATAKLPRNIAAATAHSLAYRQVGKHYRHRLDSVRQNSNAIARRLGLDPFMCQVGGSTKVVQPSSLAGYVMKAITRFCNSAEVRPTKRDIAYVDGIDMPDPDGQRTYANNDALKDHCVDAIDAAWADIQRVDGQLRFTPDNYLKIWELGLRGAPVIPGEFILWDEAQDASPVMLSVIEQQDKQVVFVGDAQQAIYEWRGAINAMDTVAAESTCYLTHSFRFGQGIADVANIVLSQIATNDMHLTGRGVDSIVGACDAPDAVLCRTNAGAVSVVLDEIDRGRVTHLVGGGGETERFAKAAKDLMSEVRTDHPELCIFDNWQQVLAYVEQDILGSEIAPMVRLIEDRGVDGVLAAVGNTVKEQDADVVVSTAHKSKGREWDAVQLHSDFPVDRMNDSEYRLLYVAVTRARRHLDIERCPAAIEVVYPDRSEK